MTITSSEQEESQKPTEEPDNVNVINNSAQTTESAYTYEEPDEEDQVAEQEAVKAVATAASLKNLPDISQYTEAVKELAQQKAFHVVFLDGKKKIYQRRKSSMKEVIELERKRAAMKRSRGTPLQVAQALADFYWASSQCHLIETRTGRPMSKADYENVIFEDFRKIIDACEFVMLFGVPS